jgi:hypothetical protein
MLLFEHIYVLSSSSSSSSSHLHSCFSRGLVPSKLSVQKVYPIFFSPICTACFACLTVISFITQIKIGNCVFSSSLMLFYPFQSQMYSSLSYNVHTTRYNSYTICIKTQNSLSKMWLLVEFMFYSTTLLSCLTL